MGKKEKKTRKKGKKTRKGRKHESVKAWQKYEVKGESISRKNSFCPRCGDGVWLSKQKNRSYCGKCGYTSFGPGKPSQPKPDQTETEQPKEEKHEENSEEAKDEPKEEVSEEKQKE